MLAKFQVCKCLLKIDRLLSLFWARFCRILLVFCLQTKIVGIFLFSY
ncbi:hypothetical protein MHA_0710 [Mannheimia haemolytica PHL213]|nr:hypothetical protein MHA_0710 [Mannheimia haemolytica PHL213]